MQFLAILIFIPALYLLDSVIKNRDPYAAAAKILSEPENATAILKEGEGKWVLPLNADPAGKAVNVGAGAKAKSGPVDNSRNGRLTDAELVPLSWARNQRLSPAAAAAAERMNQAYRAQFGRNISITDSYRTYAQQVATRAAKGAFAAPPGTSRHGLGIALDLGGGINRWDTAERNWMVANAPKFGWHSPAWAQKGQKTPEPWHWEFN